MQRQPKVKNSCTVHWAPNAQPVPPCWQSLNMAPSELCSLLYLSE
uniref:Uncharacterized protein n=1 Tax=Anguilla anguilla TaxID=7936 RepID=A0A0E9U6G5_ANGAN